MIILQTENLTKRFGSLLAVDGLNLSVEKGEAFGLLGPNGAGKSTVIKMLTTLLPPTTGTAKIAGFDIVKQPGNVRRAIGYVPQAISADGTLSATENLMIFAKLYDIPRARREPLIKDALELLGLSAFADKRVQTFSGGMIRRLEIAQSMLHSPSVLFLDEPTVGLDPLARSMVWEHIRQLRDQFGMTIFLTTHFMEEADSLCSRIAIMDAGKVAALGTPEELKQEIGGNGTTLDEVFIHYTGGRIEAAGGYHETAKTRRTLSRLG